MAEILINISDQDLKKIKSSAFTHRMDEGDYLSLLVKQVLLLPDPLNWFSRLDAMSAAEVVHAKENPIQEPFQTPVPVVIPLVKANSDESLPRSYTTDLTHLLQELVISSYLKHWCPDPENPTTAEIADIESLLAMTFFGIRSFYDYTAEPRVNFDE